MHKKLFLWERDWITFSKFKYPSTSAEIYGLLRKSKN